MKPHELSDAETLDRLIWAATEWYRGWKPDSYISDRRTRDLYEAIKAYLIREATKQRVA